MKKLEEVKTGNRRHAAGYGLRLAGACCRACLHHIETGWIKRLNRKLGLINIFNNGGPVAKRAITCHSQRSPKGEVKNLDADEILRGVYTEQNECAQDDKKIISQRSHNTNKKMICKCAGQHIAEYAVLITMISMALTIMYVYTKRGLQAAIKNKVYAEIGPQIDSAPLMGLRELQNSISESEAIGSDESRVQMSPTGAMRYTTSSVSYASGNGTVNSGQVFVPEDAS